eukprot:COSAG05_NODE_1182_length_5594_cov_31.189081_4_plen_177_part_00
MQILTSVVRYNQTLDADGQGTEGMGELWRQSSRRLRNAVVADETTDNHKSTRPQLLPKLCLFSAHDSTIFPMMTCLLPDWGLGNHPQLAPLSSTEYSEWSPFAANVTIELWCLGLSLPTSAPDSSKGVERQEKFFVRALYQGLAIPHANANLDGFCSLEEWESLLAPFVALDMAKL